MNMQKLKSHFLIFFAVIMFLLKPFLGFCIIDHLPVSAHKAVISKAFAKCREKNSEDTSYQYKVVVKLLDHPFQAFFLNSKNNLFQPLGLPVTATLLGSGRQLSPLRSHLFLLGKLSI
jgi:hypothetical protein